MKRPTYLALLLLATSSAVYAQQQDQQATDLMELEVISSPREDGAMRKQPASTSLIDSTLLKHNHNGSLKNLSTMAPNFFMPDYGSRLSSAVYIRGIGSRINSPAIGLYIDDVPVLDKASFDFALYDMQRVDVLRGPQSTLYGSGTMGGVMRVYSPSPFTHQGTSISMGYASNENARKMNLAHYSKPTEHFAWALTGFFNGGDGFFKNQSTGEKMDYISEGGLRLRAMFLTRHNWMLDLSASYELSTEGAYPYYYVGRRDGQPEDKASQLNHINNNLAGMYERNIIRTSLKVSKTFRNVEMSSITSFQALKDTMQMDQDFLADDIYKLNQNQKNRTVSEDLLFKSKGPGRWQWITGAAFSLHRSHTLAPVTFRKDGVAMLNTLINQQANAFMPVIESGPMTMHMLFDDQIQGNELLFDSKFRDQNISTGAFHQSTLKDLFGVEGFSATAGLRLQADFQQLNYTSTYDFTHRYQLAGHLTTPGGEQDITMVPEQEFTTSNGLLSSDHAATSNGIVAKDPIHDRYLELLPRVALQYEWNGTRNIYATVSRGYRQGGYNTQNISESLRSLMVRDIMSDVSSTTIPVLNAQPMVPQATKDQVSGILNTMASTPTPDIKKAVTYAPEYAWNYEIGTHLILRNGLLGVDASAFLADIRNMQLSQMSASGLGREMVNAGKSRSLGAELSVRAQPADGLLVQINYGYTHATFRDYTCLDASTQQTVDCKGKFVPFMPQHTLNLDIAYTVPLNEDRPRYALNEDFIARSITFSANYSGAGRIYWTEQNDAWQNFYSQLGANVTMDIHPLYLTVWGRNLTNSRHNTFWFVSANRAYEQHVRPIQFGFDACLKF